MKSDVKVLSAVLQYDWSKTVISMELNYLHIKASTWVDMKTLERHVEDVASCLSDYAKHLFRSK